MNSIKYTVPNYNSHTFYVIFEDGSAGIFRKLQDSDNYFRLGLIDEEDVEKMKAWNVHMDDKGYLRCNRGETRLLLHRYLLNVHVDNDEHIDHKNLDPSDNRKANLRLCNRSQNMYNRTKWEGCSSKYIGVCWSSTHNAWRARLRVEGKLKHFGYYDSELQAGRVSDAVRRLYLDLEFAHLNFPEEVWKIAKIQERPKKVFIEQVNTE